MIVFTLIFLFIAISYYLLHLKYQYWKIRMVSGPKPTFIFGNLVKCFTFKASPGAVYTSIYNQYPQEVVVGLYRATTPAILIRDPELIKEVTVKSFNNFHDNDIDVDKNRNLLFGRSPFALRGEEWKVARAQLTPCFTSGKMKLIYPLLEDISTNLVKFIDKQPAATNEEGYEAKELCIRFTLNNVASCAFGLEGRCLEENNSHFRQLARDFFSADSWSIFCFFLITVFPPLSKVLTIRFITKKVEEKIISMVTKTLKYREENNIVRNDFLHIVSQLKKTCKDYEFTDLDVAAHAAGFFGDGYETSSTVMSFALFELAANPVVQSKLRKEVDTAFQENSKKLPYDVLQSLEYLDAVINETLRLHPPLLSMSKLCTKPFTFVPTNGTSPVTIEEGTSVILPVYALQHDPKYYKDPDSFKPERFVGKNRDDLTKYTFLPMGEGPRACLGQRFGILQIKVGIAYIVQNYELLVNKKTRVPIRYDPVNVLTAPIGGLWLDFRQIKQ